LRERLPHRPRRYWRYVSPQRRGAALLFLALLLTAVYGYWYLTNDSRIKRQAMRYLRGITGARVRIGDASFGLFNEIRLEEVSVAVPGPRGFSEFFQADRVILKHNPWSVFFGGRIQPTEIVSLNAEVVESPATRAFLSVRSLRDPGGTGAMDLPAIRVDTCIFRRIEEVDGIPLPEKRFNLKVDMIPRAGRMVYDVHIAERKDELIAQKYRVEVQLAPTFKGVIVSGSGDLVATGDALPPEYSKWLKDYQVKGRYRFKGPFSVSDSTVKDVLTLELEDVAFTLPQSQGGLAMEGVWGTVTFRPPGKSGPEELKNGRIEFAKDIKGRLVDAGGVKVRLSGQYQGYSLDSPFKVNIEIDELTLPILPAKTLPATDSAGGMHPQLKYIIERVNRDYSPVGTAQLSVTLSRTPGQKHVSVDGTVKPVKISASYNHVPYRVDIDDCTDGVGVDGSVRFDSSKVIVENITARREDEDNINNVFVVNAASPLKRDSETGKWEWRAHIKVVSADLTDALAKALPREAFLGKPYPLAGMKGVVHARDGRIWVNEEDYPLRVFDPDKMNCKIYGEIKWDSQGVSTDVHVEADKVPIDKALTDSLNQAARDAIGLLDAQGALKTLSVTINARPDRKLKYDVTADLQDVRVTYEGFPYGISGISGIVQLDQDKITLNDLSGGHNDTPVKISGSLYPGGEKVGVELEVVADDLVVDKELRAALPADMKRIWDSLSPSGRADVVMTLNQNVPGASGKPSAIGQAGNGDKPEYRLEIRSKGMTATYKDFPYKFDGLTGLVIAEPKGVELRKLECDRGFQVDGLITDRGRTLKLRINAKGVPLDKKLLAAMPGEFKTAMSTVRAGGSMDVKIKDLTIVRPRIKSSSPTTQRGAKDSPSGIKWSVDGVLDLHDAIVDVAFGPKKLSGTLDGQIVSDQRGLMIDVAADFRKITVSNREITDVKGQVTKKAGSPLMRIKDIQARAYGGRLAGREVLIRLSDPAKYAFRLFYQGVSLGSLVDAGQADPNKRSGVKGSLEGRISMEAVAGDLKSRRAAGTVIITKGKLYKMPIMLGLMHVLYLSLPSDAAFTDGQLRYFVQGDTMVIEEIFLTGSALSLVGSGRIELSNERLDLTFLTGPPGRLPRIAVIRGASKVLNAILKELLVIRVTGTMSKPIRKGLPLRSLDAILKELLSPGKAM